MNKEFIKGLFISFIIFIIFFILEAIFYVLGGALAFGPMTITSPLPTSIYFALPFLIFNLIAYLLNKNKRNVKRGIKYGFLFSVVFFICIFGINLYMFVYQKETYIGSEDIKMLNEAPPGDKSVCSNLRDKWKANNCFSKAAFINKDVAPCDKMVEYDDYSIKEKSDCYLYALVWLYPGVKETDLFLYCNKIISGKDKDTCLTFAQVKKTGNATLCSSIKNDFFMKQCKLIIK